MKIVDHGYMETKHDLSIEFGEEIKALILKDKNNMIDKIVSLVEERVANLQNK